MDAESIVDTQADRDPVVATPRYKRLPACLQPVEVGARCMHS